ncbi:MAG: stage 0 sporulation family protein [Bacillota bacterium]|nr:stage 0 sporulation family protein [Bacillota bacterium]
MPDAIALRFRGGGRTIDYDPDGLDVQIGDLVIVETENGLEAAVAASVIRTSDDTALRKILRFADDDDLETLATNRQREREAFRVCRDMIDEHGLEMRLVDARYTFDTQKLLFYFTADGRVDFRALVRDLAVVFHRRIELRQIGIRDEARMIGGIAVCGREFCCSTWLQDFAPVSVRMAKNQNLSMNPTKISGSCGRLMCCLKFEDDHYTEAHRRAPRINSMVGSPRGSVRVVSVDLLHETAEVELPNAITPERFRYAFDELDYQRGRSERPSLPPEGERAPRPDPRRGRKARQDDAKLDETPARADAPPPPRPAPRPLRPVPSARPVQSARQAAPPPPQAQPLPRPARATTLPQPLPQPPQKEESAAPVEREGSLRSSRRRRGRRRGPGKPAGGFLPHPIDPASLPSAEK